MAKDKATPRKVTSYGLASQWLDDMANRDGRWNWSHQQAARSLAALLRKYAKREGRNER